MEAIDEQQASFHCHPETIKCPECGHIQTAMVQETEPFYTYLHECYNCGYMIMESEWITPTL